MKEKNYVYTPITATMGMLHTSGIGENDSPSTCSPVKADFIIEGQRKIYRERGEELLFASFSFRGRIFCGETDWRRRP